MWTRSQTTSGRGQQPPPTVEKCLAKTRSEEISQNYLELMLANFSQLLISICKSNREELNSVGIHQVLSEGSDLTSSSGLLIVESVS